ncbi:MAG: multiprotein bridging factor aMBF1 [Candidatus Nezhaarchaeota archaeon]|nr:multiprotein bridging factor aMBF1 [Candidatus Nezhaarchaeota archaeon]
MQCEICGRNIQGPPKRVIIDVAVFLACNACARYGVPASKPRPTLSLKTTKPAASRTSEGSEQRFEVVPNFSALIKRAREELGLTQDVLAKLVGEKLSVIRRIEAGRLRPSIELAKKLERGLKIKLTEELKVSEPDQFSKSKIGLTLGDLVVVKGGDRKRGGALDESSGCPQEANGPEKD